ncbi:unnamed protein product [Oikopleura dioica]|uniref:Surfeit locus protein 4 n=1 Tax=Oikopleura dioica TaxID=34765 RepID=E4X1C0_OIKDI|nr:unnamed protein product [Oikopleura dioica]CBY35367.1 unnamed protein product [Oikopleura dioica]
MVDQHLLIQNLEEKAEELVRKTRKYLPHIGRFCLISTFVEDGFRMVNQWGEQRDYIESVWNCGWFIAVMFVFLNLVVQISASFCVMSRIRVKEACFALFFIIFMQTIGYSILWDPKFLARNLALVGAVLLLYSECLTEQKTLFAGVPSFGEDSKPKQYIQLSGRLLMVLMFMTLIKFNWDSQNVIAILFGLPLVLMVAAGYKTKLVSVALIFLLIIHNMRYNNFWRHSTKTYIFDFKKFDFFQGLSVIGGIIQLIVYGPGGLSVDDRLKAE